MGHADHDHSHSHSHDGHSHECHSHDGHGPSPPGSSMTPSEIEQEQQSYLRIVQAFRKYREDSLTSMAQRMQHFENLHPKYKEMFGDHRPIFARWRDCILKNALFLEGIAVASQYLFDCYWPQGLVAPLYEVPTPLDMDKVGSTLKQFVRDWGEEGKEERAATYDPIYECLEKAFPNRDEREEVKVLVPGSGLSRLAFELSLRGFWTQGNEFSHHMLIAGHYVLNHLTERESHAIYPYVDNSVNIHDREDQTRCIRVPDMCPYEAIQQLEAEGKQQGSFSMVAGDFLEVYNKPHEAGTWGAVVTCFFIDTAHNIFEYIETIHRLLRPGGVWVNIGPLLYHFSGDANEISVDLSYDEVRRVIETFGFKIHEERRVPCGYTNDARGMKWTVYNSKFFYATKEGDPTTSMGNVFAVQPPVFKPSNAQKVDRNME